MLTHDESVYVKHMGSLDELPTATGSLQYARIHGVVDIVNYPFILTSSPVPTANNLVFESIIKSGCSLI